MRTLRSKLLLGKKPPPGLQKPVPGPPGPLPYELLGPPVRLLSEKARGNQRKRRKTKLPNGSVKTIL